MAHPRLVAISENHPRWARQMARPATLMLACLLVGATLSQALQEQQQQHRASSTTREAESTTTTTRPTSTSTSTTSTTNRPKTTPSLTASTATTATLRGQQRTTQAPYARPSKTPKPNGSTAMPEAQQRRRNDRQARGSSQFASPSQEMAGQPEGLVQVKRVARNVRRKLDQMSDRVDQIQSMIAQDHSPGDSTGASATTSGNRESRSNMDALWSAPLDSDNESGDHALAGGYAQQVSGASDSLGAAVLNGNNSSESQRWSSPVIRSVIPGRQPASDSGGDQVDSAPSEETSGKGQSGAANGQDQDQDQAQQTTSVDQQQQQQQQQQLGDKQSGGAPTELASNELAAGELTRNQTGEQGQALPSMMGPEWIPNQNYHYFSELNAKNHGGGGSVIGDTYEPLGGATSSSNTGRFQNMTILNRDTDLANSYSAAGPTLMMSNLTATPPSSTTRRPDLDQQQQQQSRQPTRKSSVHTYSAGNYGKSSKDLHATSTTSQPYLSQEHTWAPAQVHRHAHQLQHHQRGPSDPSDYSNGRQNGSAMAASEPAHVLRWPTLATPAPPSTIYLDQTQSNQIGLPPSESNLPASNRYSSVMMPPSSAVAFQQQQQQHQHQGQMRTHRTSSNSNQDHQDEPTESTALSDHKYSVALPPAEQVGGNDLPEHDRRRSLEARRQLSTSTDTTIYERHHDQQAPPSPISSGSPQETSTIVVQAQQQQQQQQQPDTYSSRVDTSGDPPGSTSMGVNATGHHQPHEVLKHRSSGNSMMMGGDDQMGGVGAGGQASDNSVVSAASTGNGGNSGSGLNTPPSMDMGGHQQQSPPVVGSTGDLQAGSTSAYSPELPYSRMAPSAVLQQQQQQQLQFDPRAYYTTSGNSMGNQDQQQASDGPSLASSYNSISQELQEGSLSAAQQQHLMNQLDQLSEQQQQAGGRPFAGTAQYYAQSQLQHSQQQQPSSIQDALQAAASAGQNAADQQTLVRQQRSELAASQYGGVGGSSDAAYAAYVQNYQQQQRALAAQLSQQQQLQRALAEQQQQQQLQQQQQQQQPTRSIARAYYGADSPTSMAQHQQTPIEMPTGQQQGSLAAAIQSSMLKRYSPETALANYLTARSSMSGGSSSPTSESSSSSSSPSTYYYQPASSASSYYADQPAVGATSAPSNAYLAYRANLASLAYQRLLAEAAASQASGGTTTATGGAGPTGGMSHGSSAMYATAAMNQPVFYEAPQSLLTTAQQQARAFSASADPSSSGSSSESGSSLASSASGAGGGRSSSSGASRRNYFGGLFKPAATSRYYYTPTILSPISLASPAGLHAIYAAPSAHHHHHHAGTDSSASPSLAHYYTAATNPYAAAAAAAMMGHHPQAHHHHQATLGYQDASSMAAAVQSYQQALAAAAAAAAASGFQPHYMAPPVGTTSAGGAGVPDAEMAESSLVSSDSSSFSSPSSGGSSSSGGSGDSSTALNDSNSESGNSSGSSSSSTKSSGSMKQWLTVASLLAGILPMGLVMASMLPMLSVAGRKKRELEFGARNFSDIFSSWQSSGILKALMQAPQYGDAMARSNASQLIGDLVASASNHQADSGTGSPQRVHHSNKSARLLGGGGGGPSSAPGGSSLKSRLLGHAQILAKATLPPVLLSNSSSPGHHQLAQVAQTAALPAPPGGQQAQQTQLPTGSGPLKSTMKRVLTKVNNLIVTAQKRKHRSSPMDSRWPVPSFLSRTGETPAGAPGQVQPLGLRSMFDFNEVKRYLADIVRARLLAVANQQQAAAGTAQQFVSPLTSMQATPTTVVASNRETPEVNESPRGVPANASEPTKRKFSLFGATTSPSASTKDLSQQQPLAAGMAPEKSAQSAQLVAEIQVNGSPQRTSPQLETPANQPLGTTSSSPRVEPEKPIANSEPKVGGNQQQLLSCLYKVVCDLAAKLKRTSKGQHSNATNSYQNQQEEEQDRLLTKQILNQLLDHIEAADRETLIFGNELRLARLSAPTSSSSSSSSSDLTSSNPVQLIQEGVMRNQCSSLFTCPDPQHFKRIFSQLRWPTR